MRWEDDDHASVGTPSRVVQYEGTNTCYGGLTFFPIILTVEVEENMP